MKARKLAALVVWFVFTAHSIHAQTTPSLNLEGTGTLGPGPGACAPAGCSGQFGAMLSGQLAQAQDQAPLQLSLQLAPPFPCVCGGPATSLCPAVIPCVAQSATTKAAAKKPNLEAQIQALQQQTQSLQQEVDAIKSGGIGFPSPPGCRAATGAGTFSGADAQYSADFIGQICSDNANNLELTGTIEIIQSPLVPALVTWAAGTLAASGAIHIPAIANANPIPVSAPMVVSIVGAVGQIPALVP